MDNDGAVFIAGTHKLCRCLVRNVTDPLPTFRSPNSDLHSSHTAIREPFASLSFAVRSSAATTPTEIAAVHPGHTMRLHLRRAPRGQTFAAPTRAAGSFHIPREGSL
jgi:hypothetical protein